MVEISHFPGQCQPYVEENLLVIVLYDISLEGPAHIHESESEYLSPKAFL